jgi:hypothetical protein
MNIYQWEECKCSVTFLVQRAIKYKSFQFSAEYAPSEIERCSIYSENGRKTCPLPSGFTILKGTVAGLQQSPSL